jgi:hypothetical protein
MFRKILYAVMPALLLAMHPFASVLAHGHTEVGDYELVIGFHNEPAYQGEPNGLDLFVTNTKTGELVNGLEETLQVEIIYGASKQELKMEAQWGQDGAYTAYVIPTAAGDYTWHIWGEIEGTPVDVTMSSSPDTFSSVEPKSAVAFPSAEPTSSELKSLAQTGLITGIAGIIVGLVGVFLALRTKRA